MIRLLISLVILVLACAGGLYFAYGAVEPCAVLAVERGDRAEARTGLPVGGIVRHLTSTPSNMGDCTLELLSSWRQRVEELISR